MRTPCPGTYPSTTPKIDEVTASKCFARARWNVKPSCPRSSACRSGLQSDFAALICSAKRYDQILHEPKYVKSFTNVGGVLDFYAGDRKPLFPGEKDMTRQAFTFQLSDHLSLWIQVNTDIEGEQLDQIVNPEPK